MSEAFMTFRVHNESGVIRSGLEQVALDALGEGDVIIRAAWSDINYKDALAVTGEGKVMRRFPLVAGIDVSGVVSASDDARYQPGDAVLVTGCGLGEKHDGGYAEYVRVPGDWVIPLPQGLSLRESMSLGTAGFTAALAMERLEQLGTRPESGPVLVTGASGGVGSIAIDIFSKAGYEVTALTGKPEQVDYLKSLGAEAVLLTSETTMGKHPLEAARWGAAIDSVGGEVLAWLTRTTRPWCNIASIGLTGGWELNTTVMPFILRGVSLIGINSVDTPRDLRLKIWQRLAGELKPRNLDRIVTHEVPLEQIDSAFRDYIDRKMTGRSLVRIQSD